MDPEQTALDQLKDSTLNFAAASHLTRLHHTSQSARGHRQEHQRYRGTKHGQPPQLPHNHPASHPSGRCERRSVAGGVLAPVRRSATFGVPVMNSAAPRSVKSIDLFSLLAFRFSPSVTCAQPLAAQVPADGSEKFSPLARSRQNFLGPGVALRSPRADAILLCEKAKKIGGARGPVTFTARGTTCRTSV